MRGALALPSGDVLLRLVFGVQGCVTVVFDEIPRKVYPRPEVTPSEKWGEPERTGTTVDRSRSRLIWFAKGHRSSFAVHLART